MTATKKFVIKKFVAVGNNKYPFWWTGDRWVALPDLAKSYDSRAEAENAAINSIALNFTPYQIV